MLDQQQIRTTCPYCGVGCGIEVARQKNDEITINGDRDHPANYGRLCSKGSALGETLGLEGRLLYPQVAGQRVSWDTALATVAGGLRRIIGEHGPDAVAFYVSGQLLTEDYYVANKLMKGFIGSANIDTNSRLCMSSSVAGHQRAFGTDTVPGNYEDLEKADLIVLVGSNLAWCHPVLYQRIIAARSRNPSLKLVVIDPRRTATCEDADLHLAIKPGTDTVLFNGLLYHLHISKQTNPIFTHQHTINLTKTLQSIQSTQVAKSCGLTETQINEFYRLFGGTEKTVTVYSQGVNQSSYGTDKVNAIINCHLATGRIGKPGMGPFSVTGQPNAMGGREVGGLANQLAAHMGFSNETIDRVGRFWQTTNVACSPGLKAVDMFRAIGEGRIRAVWIMATNPVVSLPDADSIKKALEGCELVIVSDACADTDTMAYANVRLPALTWGEKDGTVTNSERRISRQRPFLPWPGEARPDWWIISQVACRLGYARAFNYRKPAQIFREHAALSGFENWGTRVFDISGLAGISDVEYNALKPVQWPFPAGTRAGTARLFGNGRFYTQSGRANFVPVDRRTPVHPVDAEFPLVLNTGRIRDQWHTMTRTGKSPRLSSHIVEPYAELHPMDGLAHGIVDGSLVRVRSQWGEVVVRAYLSEAQQPGSLFVPMHWSSQFASSGRIGAVVNPEVDPLSGQPESKHTPVCIQSYRPAWQGFALSRIPLSSTADTCSFWVIVKGKQFWRYELAGESFPNDWQQWAHQFAGAEGGHPLEWIDYMDRAAGCFRSAAIHNNRMEFCIFIAPSLDLPSRSWLAGLFDRQALRPEERRTVLTGRPAAGRPDHGRIVCSCFGVGLNSLVDAIRSRKLTTPQEIGAALQAGTNCGSCVPELRALIAQESTKNAA